MPQTNEVKLIPVDEVQKDQISDQILLRYRIIRDMVGDLYPAILYDEIERLQERRLLK